MIPPGFEPFARAALEADAPAAAAALVGAYLLRAPSEGVPARLARIVEVEAYGGEEDLASHARSGRTPRNAAMWAAPGTAYVYLVYGMYDCLNVVAAPAGRASAVLIRAAEPLGDPAPFREARARHAATRRRVTASTSAVRAIAPERLLAGPGVLAAALDVTRAVDGADLLDPAAPLCLVRAVGSHPIGRSGAPPRASGPRIGIGYAPEPWRSRPWRILDPESPSISVPFARGSQERGG